MRLESDADLVKVVTVHKSRANTRWSVCRCGELVSGRQGADLPPPVQIDAPARELDYNDAQLAQADKERLREDLRLLYVALTRRAMRCGWG